MRIIFIRHGETDVNLKGRIHYTNDEAELNEKGIQQIQSSFDILKSNGVEKVYCSPEKRTIQSADLISKKLNVPLEILGGLRERNWGDWKDKSWDEIKEKLEVLTLKQRYNFAPPDGESWQGMEARLKKGLGKIIKGKEKSVGVVTHAGCLRGLMPVLQNKELNISFKYDFQNGSITIFDYKKGKFKEVLVNDVSHLTAR